MITLQRRRHIERARERQEDLEEGKRSRGRNASRIMKIEELEERVQDRQTELEEFHDSAMSQQR